MPYRDKIFFVGGFYHVYNRGFLKRKIFYSEKDADGFVERMAELCGEKSLNLHVYCLMPNHFHMLVEQKVENGVGDFLSRLQGGYAKFFNKKYEQKGQVFEGRFKAKLIETDEYLLQVSKYIHRNPVVAGLIKNGLTYKWSSYRSYVSELRDNFLVVDRILSYFNKTAKTSSYRSFVDGEFDEKWPLLLDDEFIDMKNDYEE